MTKNDEQFCFLNTVSTSLNRHSCEPNNNLVNIPKVVSKKVCLEICSQSSTNWNREEKAPLRCLDFKGFFELLDRRSNDNTFVFVLEKLDENELKHQFDVHNVVFQCNIRDGELGKISTPSLEELSLFKKGNFDNYSNRLVHRLVCNIFR